MKKALVTGASRGIGYAIAKKLSQNDCKVVITGRNIETLERVASELGKNVLPMFWNAMDFDKANEKIAQAADMLGGLDIVVNNAGIFAQRYEWDKHELLKTTPREWSDVITVNASAVFFTMQAAVNYMLEHHIKGNILNVTSVTAEEPVYGAYGGSKILATGLTRGWGKMFAADGITINGIAPGPVATEMNNWHEGDSMKCARIPYGRFATIDEIAGLAMYLLDEKAKMVCGETVIIDGAYSIRGAK